MSKFEATINGKAVNLSLNLGRVMYGKQNGTDLGNLEGVPVVRMWLDPEVLGKTCWDLYQDRIKAVAMVQTQSEFNELLDGDTRRSIEAAMKEAITDFFSWGASLIKMVTERLGDLENLMNSFAASGRTSGDTPGSSE